MLSFRSRETRHCQELSYLDGGCLLCLARSYYIILYYTIPY